MLLPATLLALFAYFEPLQVLASPSTTSEGERLLQTGSVQRVLEHEPVRDTDCRHPVSTSTAMMTTTRAECHLCQPLGPIETTQCNYETIESVNDDLYHLLHEVVDSPFFKYYKVLIPLARSDLQADV
jgi:ERO1-like protein beta